jgi:hypothetical protein
MSTLPYFSAEERASENPETLYCSLVAGSGFEPETFGL